jgi:hypothetical protein
LPNLLRDRRADALVVDGRPNGIVSTVFRSNSRLRNCGFCNSFFNETFITAKKRLKVLIAANNRYFKAKIISSDSSLSILRTRLSLKRMEENHNKISWKEIYGYREGTDACRLPKSIIKNYSAA